MEEPSHPPQLGKCHGQVSEPWVSGADSAARCATVFEQAAQLVPTQPLAINSVQLRYWELTGYSASELLRVARKRDGQDMFVMLSFDGTGNVSARLSGHTWARQEGHYPTVIDFFSELGQHPLVAGLKGDVLVWLDDGVWTWQQESIRSVPVFAYGRHINDTRTILMPDPAFLGGHGYKEELAHLAMLSESYPWEERKETAYFRGAGTGLGFNAGTWRESARGRLALLAKKLQRPEMLDAKITRVRHLEEDCKAELREDQVMGDEAPFDSFVSYKYLVDADGYCCAWRSLFLKMAMGAVVLKIDSSYRQWYYDRLKPWTHYVPIASDLSDFEDVYSWLQEHQSHAKEIAENGQRFVQGLLYSDARDEMALYLKHVLTCQRAE